MKASRFYSQNDSYGPSGFLEVFYATGSVRSNIMNFDFGDEDTHVHRRTKVESAG